jgi:hypothetical protein
MLPRHGLVAVAHLQMVTVFITAQGARRDDILGGVPLSEVLKDDASFFKFVHGGNATPIDLSGEEFLALTPTKKDMEIMHDLKTSRVERTAPLQRQNVLSKKMAVFNASMMEDLFQNTMFEEMWSDPDITECGNGHRYSISERCEHANTHRCKNVTCGTKGCTQYVPISVFTTISSTI